MLHHKSALNKQTLNFPGGVSLSRMHDLVVPSAQPIVRGKAEKHAPIGNKNAEKFSKRREVACHRLLVEDVEAGDKVELSGGKWKVEDRGARDAGNASLMAKLQGEWMNINAGYLSVVC